MLELYLYLVFLFPSLCSGIQVCICLLQLSELWKRGASTCARFCSSLVSPCAVRTERRARLLLSWLPSKSRRFESWWLGVWERSRSSSASWCKIQSAPCRIFFNRRQSAEALHSTQISTLLPPSLSPVSSPFTLGSEKKTLLCCVKTIVKAHHRGSHKEDSLFQRTLVSKSFHLCAVFTKSRADTQVLSF